MTKLMTNDSNQGSGERQTEAQASPMDLHGDTSPSSRKVNRSADTSMPSSNLTASVGTSLTLKNLEDFVNSDFRGFSRTLVAPNKRIAKEWAKQYPGWTIILSEKL